MAMVRNNGRGKDVLSVAEFTRLVDTTVEKNVPTSMTFPGGPGFPPLAIVPTCGGAAERDQWKMLLARGVYAECARV